MKKPISLIVYMCLTSCLGCTFHPPTLSNLVDQARLSNEEIALTRECQKEIDPATTMRCLQRAKSWRIPSSRDTSTDKRESADTPLAPQK